MQDLVGVRVADARNLRLVAQQALDLRAVTTDHVAEPVEGEVIREGVGAEPRDAGHLLWVADDIDGEALLRALLGQVEARAVGQMHAERDRPLARLEWRRRQLVAPVQPAGARQVRDEVQTVDVEVQELAVPGGAGDLESLQGAHRWGERLEHIDGSNVDPRDDLPDAVLGQERDQGLDLRQLRHAPIVSSRRHAQPSSPSRSSSIPKWCATSCTTVIWTWRTTSSCVRQRARIGSR